MMSLTSVCEPKPMATPKTPAPAISGPTLDPEAGKNHHAGDDRDEGCEKVRRIGSSVRTRMSRAAVQESVLSTGPFQVKIDKFLRQLPDEIGR